MIIDFTKVCNNYDLKLYDKEYFVTTPCPSCPAVGRFIMYGSYQRYILYFEKNTIYYKSIDIKRVMCMSCKITHAVVPGDIIPYKLLSLFVMLCILIARIIKKTPITKTAKKYGISYQLIYSYQKVLSLYKNRIHQFFKETSSNDTPDEINLENVLGLIKKAKPYKKFQSDYLKLNLRPCFMSKFFDRTGAPRFGPHAANFITT